MNFMPCYMDYGIELGIFYHDPDMHVLISLNHNIFHICSQSVVSFSPIKV